MTTATTLKQWRGLPKEDWASTATRSIYRLPLAFLLLGCGIFLVYNATAHLHPVAIETCQLAPYRRDLNPDNVELLEGGPWLPKAVREVLFFWLIRLVIGALWLALLFYSTNKIGGYFVGLAIIEELKLRSSDFECHSAHPNGFSGHAFYGMWALCTIYYYYLHLSCALVEHRTSPKMRWEKGRFSAHSEQFRYVASSPYSTSNQYNIISDEDQDQYIALDQLRDELTRREEVSEATIPRRTEIIVSVVALFCILTQLIYTYRYGYHSPRQMLLAASIGALYCALSFLLSQVIILTFRAATTTNPNENKQE